MSWFDSSPRYQSKEGIVLGFIKKMLGPSDPPHFLKVEPKEGETWAQATQRRDNLEEFHRKQQVEGKARHEQNSKEGE